MDGKDGFVTEHLFFPVGVNVSRHILHVFEAFDVVSSNIAAG